jgi:hypothetical protein
MIDVPSVIDATKGWGVLSDRIAEALRLPANAWVLLPAHADTEDLMICLRRAIHDPVPEHLPWAPGEEAELYQTLVTYGATEPLSGRASREDFLTVCAKSGRDANLIVDLTTASEAEQVGFASLMRDWQQSVRMLGPEQPWPRFICLLSTPRRWQELDDVCLAVVPSWEIATTCEGCFQWQPYIDERNGTEKLWLRAVLPELAAFDRNLAEYSDWRRVTGMETLLSALKDVVRRRGWVHLESDLQSCLARIPASGTLPADGGTYLPASLHQLWHQGMLGLVAGVGWDLHAAVLALPAGQSGLRHRVWRGQARVLGPVLEGLRLRAEHSVRREVGNSRFETRLAEMRNGAQSGRDWVVPETQRPSLHEIATFARESSLPWWRAAARAHREVRNPLAHGFAIEPIALRSLIDLSGCASEWA